MRDTDWGGLTGTELDFRVRFKGECVKQVGGKRKMKVTLPADFVFLRFGVLRFLRYFVKVLSIKFWIMASYIRFDWAMKRLLRNKADYVVIEGLLTSVLNTPVEIEEVVESQPFETDDISECFRADLLIRINGEQALVEIQNNNVRISKANGEMRNRRQEVYTLRDSNPGPTD